MTPTISLMEIMQEHLASDDLELPIFAPQGLELQTAISADTAIEEIEEGILRDQVVSTQVLRMANSAFYCGLKPISTVREAIVRLGITGVANLVFLMKQRQQYGSSDKFLKPYLGRLWQHAASCAIGSKWLAERLGHQSVAQEAFMAGLLHDIGHLFLLKVLETIDASRKPDIELSDAVLAEVLESMHTTHGTLLLQKWNLPELYCDVVRLHHAENYDYGSVVITIVRMVNLTCRKLGIGLHHDPSVALANSGEAQCLRVSEVLLAELEIMLEDSVQIV